MTSIDYISRWRSVRCRERRAGHLPWSGRGAQCLSFADQTGQPTRRRCQQHCAEEPTSGSGQPTGSGQLSATAGVARQHASTITSGCQARRWCFGFGLVTESRPVGDARWWAQCYWFFWEGKFSLIPLRLMDSLCGSVDKDFIYHACGHEFESRLKWTFSNFPHHLWFLVKRL